MTSPFPGMDPYLEDPAYWPDFHSTFINYWREALADELPDAYEASIGERVCLIESDPVLRKLISPDVSVFHEDAAPSESELGGGVATLEPITIPLAILDGPREGFIEILHRPERSLVTALELLSPTNKDPNGRTEYIVKRNAVLRQQAHLVELDLLVGGTRPPLQKRWPAGNYHYLVSRWEARPDSQVYSWTVQNQLPTLPVPLRAPDGDVMVDLSKVFATAYDRGRFGRRIRYSLPCPAALSATGKAWVEARVAKR